MDVRFINPFMVSIHQVFKTMVNLEIQVLKPTLKRKGETSADVSSVIGFSGDAAGACVLCFSSEVACRLAGAFAGEEMTPQHPDFADALGELANMIAGGAKARFDGLSVSISLPSVIIGKEHEVSVTGVSSDAPRLMIPCESEMGNFFVEIAMVVKTPKDQTESKAAPAAGALS